MGDQWSPTEYKRGGGGGRQEIDDLLTDNEEGYHQNSVGPYRGVS